MKLLKLLICTCLCLCTFVSFGQKNCKQPPVHLQEWSVEKNSAPLQEIQNFDGTFQIQMSNEDSFAFNTNFLELIESSRKDVDDVILDLGNNRKSNYFIKRKN